MYNFANKLYLEVFYKIVLLEYKIAFIKSFEAKIKICEKFWEWPKAENIWGQIGILKNVLGSKLNFKNFWGQNEIC